MLAMALYPDVMRKAQHEINTVVGGGRLPTFADAPNLPYLRAMDHGYGGSQMASCRTARCVVVRLVSGEKSSLLHHYRTS